MSTTEKTTWVNRIVGTGEENPEMLAANPKNWRIHPRHQQEALEAVLRRIGWVQDIIVNRTTGYVLDGHLRVALSLSKGEQSIPVSYVELTEAEEDLILSSLDPTSSLATADAESLNRLLNQDTEGELEALFGAAEPEPPPGNDFSDFYGGDAGPQPEPGEEADPGTSSGLEYLVMCPECGAEFTAAVE